MRTILIVDDDQNIRDGLTRTIRRSGLDAACQTAYDGRDAIEKLAASGADVVISDVNMPRMDGLELLTRMRAEAATQHVPVIMLTGHDEGKVRRTALDLGAFDFLVKPTDPVELIARLRNALRTKAYEDQLRERNQLFENQIVQLQRLENLAFMAAGIVHDLNGAFTILSGHIELVERAVAEGKPIHSSLASMHKAVDNAQALIARILGLNRQENPLPQPCSLSEIVTETMTVLGHTVRGRIELRWNESENGITITGYLTELRQLVMNLCVNAIQAIADTGIVQVTLDPVTLGEDRDDRLWQLTPGEYALLRVSDTGLGISPECIGRIFEPFYTSKPSGQGTGLGLSVVDRAVRNHNGAVLVDSTPGTGAVFGVYLPFVLRSRNAVSPGGDSRYAEEKCTVR
jgi:signal transduction histidine kinase